MASVQPQDWYAGKCDNLSFLRVCLSQMDGTNGYAPLLEGGNPAPLRKLLFGPRQCVILQSSLFDNALGDSRSRDRGGRRSWARRVFADGLLGSGRKEVSHMRAEIASEMGTGYSCRREDRNYTGDV